MPYRITAQGEKRRAARRAKIVVAARKLFATQGYAVTTMQQVVAKAGTSIGNCYFYFPNKEALLSAVVEEMNAKAGQAIDAAIARVPEGPNRLAAAIYTGVAQMVENASLARLALTEVVNSELRTTSLSFFTDRVRRFFEEAAPSLLGDADLELVARAWQGAIFHVLEGVATGSLDADADTLGRFLVQWNMQALGMSKRTVEQALASLSDLALPT